MEYAFYNGELCERDNIKVPLSDRSIFFGDGIYEALIGGNGKIYHFTVIIPDYFRGVMCLGKPFS